MSYIKSKITILLVILAVLSVFLYQFFYVQEKDIPEIIQTVSQVQMSDTLNLGIFKFDTMNPIKSKNEQVQQICKLIYEPLFDISYDFKLVPCLAKECMKIDDMTYIVRLRDNVYWHDGSLLNTTDIEYVINQIQDDESSIFYNNVKNIKNAKVVDEITLRIELYESEPFFEYNLIFPIIKDEMVGTGKYKLENDYLKYNEIYWKQINPLITTININKYNEMEQFYSDFKNGEIDVINTKKNEYKAVLGETGYNKKEYQGREYTYLELNNLDTDVRQAIYYSIKKSEIIAKVFNSNYYDIDFPLDTVNWLYNDSMAYKYDIEKAIQILEKNDWKYESGFWLKNNKKLIVNLLLESTDKFQNEIAYILKDQLSKVGIQVKIEKVSKNLYNYYLKKKNYDIIINTMFIGISPKLNSFFENNEIVRTIENTNSERQLIELYKELQDEYNQNLPFINLCCNKQTMLYSEKIYGSIRPNWYNIFYDIENWKKINKST